jgi:hypothetical protein
MIDGGTIVQRPDMGKPERSAFLDKINASTVTSSPPKSVALRGKEHLAELHCLLKSAPRFSPIVFPWGDCAAAIVNISCVARRKAR